MGSLGSHLVMLHENTVPPGWQRRKSKPISLTVSLRHQSSPGFACLRFFAKGAVTSLWFRHCLLDFSVTCCWMHPDGYQEDPSLSLLPGPPIGWMAARLGSTRHSQVGTGLASWAEKWKQPEMFLSEPASVLNSLCSWATLRGDTGISNQVWTLPEVCGLRVIHRKSHSHELVWI